MTLWDSMGFYRILWDSMKDFHLDKIQMNTTEFDPWLHDSETEPLESGMKPTLDVQIVRHL